MTSAGRALIELTVNGRPVQVHCERTKRLAEILRDDLGLTGTKLGCEIGVCGACTVLLDGIPVSACLTLGFQVDGRHVCTIEGVAGPDSLHPVQTAMLESGGYQCGFCTPGQIVAAVALLEQNEDPGDDDIVSAMSGNLCRCTGYYPILAAIKLAAQRMRSIGPEPDSNAAPEPGSDASS